MKAAPSERRPTEIAEIHRIFAGVRPLAQIDHGLQHEMSRVGLAQPNLTISFSANMTASKMQIYFSPLFCEIFLLKSLAVQFLRHRFMPAGDIVFKKGQYSDALYTIAEVPPCPTSSVLSAIFVQSGNVDIFSQSGPENLTKKSDVGNFLTCGNAGVCRGAGRGGAEGAGKGKVFWRVVLCRKR